MFYAYCGNFINVSLSLMATKEMPAVDSKFGSRSGLPGRFSACLLCKCLFVSPAKPHLLKQYGIISIKRRSSTNFFVKIARIKTAEAMGNSLAATELTMDIVKLPTFLKFSAWGFNNRSFMVPDLLSEKHRSLQFFLKDCIVRFLLSAVQVNHKLGKGRRHQTDRHQEVSTGKPPASPSE